MQFENQKGLYSTTIPSTWTEVKTLALTFCKKQEIETESKLASRDISVKV